MKKTITRAAKQYEQTAGCTIQETALGIGIMAVGVVCIWMAAVLQGGAACSSGKTRWAPSMWLRGSG